MHSYSPKLIHQAQNLRALGKTYSEIRENLKLNIPKSTLSDWCGKVKLPDEYQARIDEMNVQNLGRAVATMVAMNKVKREEFFAKISQINIPVAEKIFEPDMAKVALAMLCLGEASKFKPGEVPFAWEIRILELLFFF